MSEKFSPEKLYDWLEQDLHLNRFPDSHALQKCIDIIQEIRTNKEEIGQGINEFDLEKSLWTICLVKGQALDKFGAGIVGDTTYIPELYVYLNKRFLECKSDYLIIRYGLLKWHLNKDFGSLEIVLKKSTEFFSNVLIPILDEHDFDPFDLIDLLKHIFIVAKNLGKKTKSEINQYRNSLRDILLSIVSHPQIQNRRSVMVTEIADIVINNKTFFKFEQVQKLQDICIEVLETLDPAEPKNSIFIEAFLNRIAELEKIVSKKSNYPHKLKMAELFEELSNLPYEIGGASHCSRAIKIYQELGNNDKVQILESKLKEKNLTAKLQTIKIPIEMDLEKITEWAQFFNSKVNKHNLWPILALAAPSIIPNIVEIKKEKSKERSINFHETINQNIIDEFGNSIVSTNTAEEIFEAILKSRYFLLLNLKKINITELLKLLLDSKKFTGRNFKRYLSATWINGIITKPTINGNISYNWLDSLAPTIDLLFKSFTNKSYIYYRANAFDRMVLLIEGIFRDFSEIIGIRTFFSDQEGVLRPKSLNGMLGEESFDKAIKEDLPIIEENDLFFLRFFMIDKFGLNIRNRVAHAKLSANEYDDFKTFLLILVLLILSKYDPGKIKVDRISQQTIT